MGFLNWLMKGVDVEENQQVVSVDKMQATDNVITHAEIPNMQTTIEPNFDNLRNLSNMEMSDSVNMSLNMNSVPNDYIGVSPVRQKSQMVVYKINNIKDLQLAIRHLATKQPCVLEFKINSKKEFNKIMEYLNGAVFALCATVHKMQDKFYIVSPEGMEIALQEKKRDKRKY